MGIREISPGQVDNIEMYNIPKFIPEFKRPHPEIIEEHLEEIEHFSRHIFDEIISKLLVLFAIILELPEEYFLDRHRYSKESDCHLRYMKYHALKEKQNPGELWVKGHTDFGSLTLLFRQPIAALQVRKPQEQWKYVKPLPGSITVNIGDSLSFLSDGYLKSSIHRVVAPPPDQANIDRLGVYYFFRPENDLELKTVPSPLLERLGLVSESNAQTFTAGEWVKARVANNVLKKVDIAAGSGEVEQEVVKGVKAKYYE